MAIPTSKPLSLSAVQTEYGGSNPISLSEYYSLGNAPASGEITLWADFNGTSNIATATSVDQIYNWYGNSTYSTEDVSQTADMVNTSTSIQPSLSAYTLYSYIDSGEPWLGKTIVGYSNLRISTKVVSQYDTDGSPAIPPYDYAIASSNVSYTAEDRTGAAVASLGDDSHGSPAGTRTLTAKDNADITGAMTDAEIKTWLSEGCPLRHAYYDEDVTDGTAFATVDTPEVYYVSILADSITYIP
jgi:hypothetical protein